MALIVQKFGGTSVGTVERIQAVACRVLDARERGDNLVVVVSAMSGETNRLIKLATRIDPLPHSREYDILLASGEQISVGLVTLAINAEAGRRGLIENTETCARGFLGHQIEIKTSAAFAKARIEAIDTRILRHELNHGVIPVIAGFQGVDSDNNITTLGRGGSDTSAVAIAVALQADDCEIYTDVDGVYTTDPRICARARKISRISYEEMLELASLGAKVLQIRAVELAAKFRLPLHVRSSFEESEGTRVVTREALGTMLEEVVVAGIASDAEQIKFTLQNVPDRSGVAAEVFGALSDASIVVDVIVQDVSEAERITVSFTVGKSDFLKSSQVLDGLRTGSLSMMKVLYEENLAKVSIVGVGMQHHPGVASKMFALLAAEGINIRLITTSEIKVSCLIAADKMKRAVECLHEGFDLD